MNKDLHTLDNYRPKPNKDWQLHWLDEQPMLFSKSHDGLHLLNPVAGFIWMCCDGKTDIKSIRKALQDVFVDSQDKVAWDLPNTLKLWQTQGLIEFNLPLNILEHKYVLRNKFLLAHKKWVSDNGDTTLRVNYNLTPESVVFDLGGYKGDFTDAIYNNYHCYIYVFEPVTSFYEFIVQRFQNNDRIKVFNFGLSDEDGAVNISLNADGSSCFINSNKQEKIILRNIVSFLDKENIFEIDLMKINIEGGEFQVLPALIKSNWVKKINNVQVQFHKFIRNAIQKRDEIRSHLQKTHTLTYDYWFIWENWAINLKHDKTCQV